MRTPIHTLLLLCAFIAGYTDVRIDIETDGALKPYFYNTTGQTWKLGGWRVISDDEINDKAASTFTYTNQRHTDGQQWIHTEQMSTSVTHHMTKMPSDGENSVNVGTTWFAYQWGTSFTPNEVHPLLRTGDGKTSKLPNGALPITLSQLDSLSALPSFYNSTYRYNYVDGLGARGGLYASGMLDTWEGETQVVFAIPNKDLRTNNHELRISLVQKNKSGATDSALLYWTMLALGQEYMAMDMQFMAASGMKETFAGVVGAPGSTKTGNEYGAWPDDNDGLGPWELHQHSAHDRALSYPKFYPDHITLLNNSKDVSEFVINGGLEEDAFMNYYSVATPNPSGGYMETPLNSASIANYYVMTALEMRTFYDMLFYSEDICWKQFLETAVDTLFAPSAMLALYNKGLGDVSALFKPLLNKNSVATSANNPNLRHQMSSTTHYWPQSIGGGDGLYGDYNGVAQDLTDASLASQTDASIEIMDFPISKNQLMSLYFGENGTVSFQGVGGMLRHFPTDNRQEIWNTLSTAFDMLKGRAPSTTGTDSISFRYDLLSLVRTVKQHFNFDTEMPLSGDAAIVITANSTTGGCSGLPAKDTTFPFMDFSIQTNALGGVEIFDTLKDNYVASTVRYTLDYNWDAGLWNYATPLGDTALPEMERVFFQSVTNDVINTAGAQQQIDMPNSLRPPADSLFMWVLGSDDNGNTLVRKLLLPIIDTAAPDTGTHTPELLSAFIEDSDGDGNGDLISARSLAPTARRNLLHLTDGTVQYSWPTQNQMVLQHDVITAFRDTAFTLQDNSLKGGSGLGQLALSYGVDTMRVDIVDKVGPVIIGAQLLESNYSDPDTVIISLSEAVQTSGITGQNFKINNILQAEIAVDILDNTTWKIVFPAGSVSAMDSINFYESSTITDMLNNGIHPQNKKVPILFTPTPLDVAPHGHAFFDRNADGALDYITVNLSTSAKDSLRILDLSLEVVWRTPTDDSVQFLIGSTQLSFNSSLNVITAEVDTQLLNKQLTYFDTTIQHWGQVVIVQPSLTPGEEQRDTLAMIDSMAPVITTASYINNGGIHLDDTLEVFFSEPVDTIMSTQPFTLEKPNGTGYTLNLLHISSATNSVLFMPISTPSTLPVTGDSIQINALSGVADTFGVEQQNSQNKKVSITVISKVSFLSASYFDTSLIADGTVDLLRVRTTQSEHISPNGIYSYIRLAPFLNDITPQNIVVTAEGFDLYVTQRDEATPHTVIDSDDIFLFDTTVTFGGTLYTGITLSVDDSIAPVITSGSYSYNRTVDKAQMVNFDTLIVSYSEEISLPQSTTIYDFINEYGQRYSLILSKVSTELSGTTVHYLVQSGSDTTFVTKGDSISLVALANIDAVSGPSQNRQTIPQPLSVEYPGYTYNVAAYPNPCIKKDYGASIANLPAEYQSYYDSNNPMMQIFLSTKGLVPANTKIAVQVKIFDALGNMISRIDESWESSRWGKAQVALPWNLRNQSGRLVASGAYHAVVHIIIEGESKPMVKTFSLGVSN